MKRATPWGRVQTSGQLAPGVVEYSTASHGGFHISAGVRATWPELLQHYAPFAGVGWYEEDEDWSIVAAALPGMFDIADRFAALQTIRHKIKRALPGDPNAALLEMFLGSTPAGRAFVEPIERWRAEQVEHGMYRAGSSCSDGRGTVLWWVPFDSKLPQLVTHHARMPRNLPRMATREQLTTACGYDVREAPPPRRRS